MLLHLMLSSTKENSEDPVLSI